MKGDSLYMSIHSHSDLFCFYPQFLGTHPCRCNHTLPIIVLETLSNGDPYFPPRYRDRLGCTTAPYLPRIDQICTSIFPEHTHISRDFLWPLWVAVAIFSASNPTYPTTHQFPHPSMILISLFHTELLDHSTKL